MDWTGDLLAPSTERVDEGATELRCSLGGEEDGKIIEVARHLREEKVTTVLALGWDLSFVDLSYARIRKTTFSHADLHKAKLSVADLVHLVESINAKRNGLLVACGTAFLISPRNVSSPCRRSRMGCQSSGRQQHQQRCREIMEETIRK
ncbi:hypothetical protein KSP40_PGU019782 [Platanthera guangdongensis]|uniref:Uncharacterized protein n=1 Tax=Platanthera guangdongensis TaxID=2320717 RepID=A0ABR2M2L1_9ASPA